LCCYRAVWHSLLLVLKHQAATTTTVLREVHREATHREVTLREATLAALEVFREETQDSHREEEVASHREVDSHRQVPALEAETVVSHQEDQDSVEVRDQSKTSVKCDNQKLKAQPKNSQNRDDE